LQASSKLELGGLQMMPHLSLEWQHEYKGGAPEVTARFPGYEDAPFRVSGQSSVADLAVVQAGVTARIRDRLSAYTDFGLGLAQDYNSQMVSLGLQYSF
jgi:outer membrane autotransporter protein